MATVTEDTSSYTTGDIFAGFVRWTGWGYVSGNTGSTLMGTELPLAIGEHNILGVYSCIPLSGDPTADFISLAGDVPTFPSDLIWADDRLTINTTLMAGWNRVYSSGKDATTWQSPDRPAVDTNYYADATDYNPTATVSGVAPMATVTTVASLTAQTNGGTITLTAGSSVQVYCVPTLGLKESVWLEHNNGVVWARVNDEEYDGIVLQESRNRATLTGPGTFRVVKSATAVATAVYYDN